MIITIMQTFLGIMTSIQMIFTTQVLMISGTIPQIPRTLIQYTMMEHIHIIYSITVVSVGIKHWGVWSRHNIPISILPTSGQVLLVIPHTISLTGTANCTVIPLLLLRKSLSLRALDFISRRMLCVMKPSLMDGIRPTAAHP